jgi:hypothetical protein
MKTDIAVCARSVIVKFYPELAGSIENVRTTTSAGDLMSGSGASASAPLSRRLSVTRRSASSRLAIVGSNRKGFRPKRLRQQTKRRQGERSSSSAENAGISYAQPGSGFAG